MQENTNTTTINADLIQDLQETAAATIRRNLKRQTGQKPYSPLIEELLTGIGKVNDSASIDAAHKIEDVTIDVLTEYLTDGKSIADYLQWYGFTDDTNTDINTLRSVIDTYIYQSIPNMIAFLLSDDGDAGTKSGFLPAIHAIWTRYQEQRRKQDELLIEQAGMEIRTSETSAPEI